MLRRPAVSPSVPTPWQPAQSRHVIGRRIQSASLSQSCAASVSPGPGSPEVELSCHCQRQRQRQCQWDGGGGCRGRDTKSRATREPSFLFLSRVRDSLVVSTASTMQQTVADGNSGSQATLYRPSSTSSSHSALRTRNIAVAICSSIPSAPSSGLDSTL
ncbi:hypothetical protein LIA77_01538 [Sarocladium implicatum]|nr:hypothetical protein LIA77_01538 [Sarocladium implicatum]